MSQSESCNNCGALLDGPNAAQCSICGHPAPNAVDQARIDTVNRIAGLSKQLLYATVPPALFVALVELPDSPSELQLIALQLFVQFYFNGRVAEQKRVRSAHQAEASSNMFDRKLRTDLFVFSGSSLVTILSYFYLVQFLLAHK